MSNKIDFKKFIATQSFPELKIIIDVVEKQRNENIDEEKILKEITEFLLGIASNSHSKVIIDINKQIADGINKLAYYKNWPNLNKIAEHAMEQCIECFEEKNRFQDIAELFKLQLFILRLSLSDLKNVFREEWLKENFPKTIK